MKKICLDPDRLAVESFPTASRTAGVRGTVRANSDDSANCRETHRDLYTCGVSCDFNNCRHTVEYDSCWCG